MFTSQIFYHFEEKLNPLNTLQLMTLYKYCYDSKNRNNNSKTDVANMKD